MISTESPAESKPLFGGLGSTEKTLAPTTNMFGGSTPVEPKVDRPAPANENGPAVSFSFKLPSATTVTPLGTNGPSNPATDPTPLATNNTATITSTTTITSTGAAAATNPTPASIFGNASSGFSFADLAKSTPASAEPEVKPFSFATSNNLSFGALAQTNANAFIAAPNSGSPGGFVGLSNRDTFKNLMGTQPNGQAKSGEAGGDEHSAEDPNYDPHYEPIIELPDEIKVSTGEENEEKVFSERAKLFRYDATNKEVGIIGGFRPATTSIANSPIANFFRLLRNLFGPPQWKERGVGDFKVLHHLELNSYRLLLRREQIHKLVLNMKLTADVEIKPNKQSDKAFTWVAQNFAEDQQNGELEQLSVRFKNVDIANRFNGVIQPIIEQLQYQAAGSN